MTKTFAPTVHFTKLVQIRCQPTIFLIYCDYIRLHNYNIHQCQVMMTSSNGNIFRVTGHLCGEFTRWISRTKASDADVFFDVRLNIRLSKQSLGWWFETPSRPLWRHRNVWSHCSPYSIVNAACSNHLWFQCFRHGADFQIKTVIHWYKIEIESDIFPYSLLERICA